LQTRTKRKLIKFLGFTGAVVLISVAATGYLFHWRMQDVLQQDAFIIKSQGLMLKERGTRLEELATLISSAIDSGTGKPPDASQKASLRKYAEEIRKQGTQLERYGGKLMADMEAKEPEGALATIADLKLLVPENLDQIKHQQKKIQELETSKILLTSRIRRLQYQLAYCPLPQRPPLPYRLEDVQGDRSEPAHE
jgi:hypothetical protein